MIESTKLTIFTESEIILDSLYKKVHKTNKRFRTKTFAVQKSYISNYSTG